MIETERLRLRAWRSGDAAALLAIRRDSRVAATLGVPGTLAEAEATVARQRAHLAEHGYCFWAAELRVTPGLIGWCGLKPGVPYTRDETEIGWSLHPDHWGKGLAREAAAATLAWAWATTDLDRIVAITTPGNTRSWRLMERLGMTRVADGDFDHPALAEGDPLRRHLTYAIERS